MGGKGTLIVMIGFGISAKNFATSGALFVATSFISSGCQKKVNSDSQFGSGEEVISFISSASGSQKKENSEMGFGHGITGDVTIFVGDSMIFIEGAI